MRTGLVAAALLALALAGMLAMARTANGYGARSLDARAYARLLIHDGQWPCLRRLWERESGWAIHARTGRAYGIPQALPGKRMASAEHPSWGPKWDDWRTDGRVQVTWGVAYVRARYGTPCHALAVQSMRGWY